MTVRTRQNTCWEVAMLRERLERLLREWDQVEALRRGAEQLCDKLQAEIADEIKRALAGGDGHDDATA